MNSENREFQYHNFEGEVVDFTRKRLEFRLDSVPSDIRRLEYDLWIRYRTLHHIRMHQYEQKRKVGRFTIKPEFTGFNWHVSWEEFQNSFLHGEERLDRFHEIVDTTKRDLPSLLSKHKNKIPEDKVRLIALSGSSVYGPRKPGEFLSDVDISFLIEHDKDDLNFEVIPELSDPIPYHLIGTGKTDAARGERNAIHWLLHPHYPIINEYSDDELRNTIQTLVLDTHKRKDEIQSKVDELDDLIAERSSSRLEE